MRYFSVAAVLATLTGLALVVNNPLARAQGPADWGTIKGQVVWGGDAVPDRKEIAGVNANQDKAHCLSKGPLLSEDWVINKKNKGIRYTFVWLAPAAIGKNLPIHPKLKAVPDKKEEIDQPCCQFKPHATAIREGQELVAKNSAPVAHNVKWAGNPLKNPGNNVILPPGGSVTIKDLKADRFPIMVNCNIHPWMNARVGVFNHPYFAVTDEDGNFEIKDAPAGNFRLMVWHESAGWRGGAAGRNGQQITIKGGEVTDLGKLDLKPSE
jgi:hypothetical protein